MHMMNKKQKIFVAIISVLTVLVVVAEHIWLPRDVANALNLVNFVVIFIATFYGLVKLDDNHV